MIQDFQLDSRLILNFGQLLHTEIIAIIAIVATIAIALCTLP